MFDLAQRFKRSLTRTAFYPIDLFFAARFAVLFEAVLDAGFFFTVAFDFSFIGLPQHHRVVLDAPTLLMTTSRAQGIQTMVFPFFTFAMLVPLSFCLHLFSIHPL
jgi:hypothetical protein